MLAVGKQLHRDAGAHAKHYAQCSYVRQISAVALVRPQKETANDIWLK